MFSLTRVAKQKSASEARHASDNEETDQRWNPPAAIQNGDAQDVGRKFHYAGQQSVDVDVPAETFDTQGQAIEDDRTDKPKEGVSVRL